MVISDNGRSTINYGDVSIGQQMGKTITIQVHITKDIYHGLLYEHLSCLPSLHESVTQGKSKSHIITAGFSTDLFAISCNAAISHYIRQQD